MQTQVHVGKKVKKFFYQRFITIKKRCCVGMNKRFIKARIIEIKALLDQRPFQFQMSGNRLRIAPKPPTWEAPFFVSISLKLLFCYLRIKKVGSVSSILKQAFAVGIRSIVGCFSKISKKIREIVKSTFIANTFYVKVRFRQKFGGMIDSIFV